MTRGTAAANKRFILCLIVIIEFSLLMRLLKPVAGNKSRIQSRQSGDTPGAFQTARGPVSGGVAELFHRDRRRRATTHIAKRAARSWAALAAGPSLHG